MELHRQCFFGTTAGRCLKSLRDRSQFTFKTLPLRVGIIITGITRSNYRDAELSLLPEGADPLLSALSPGP